MTNKNIKPVAFAVCAAVGGLALSGSTFASNELGSGYMAAASAVAGGDKAAEGKCGEGKCGMDKADTDKDGRISRAEFAAAHPDKASHFAAMDANSDGFIDAAEHKMKMEGKCGADKARHDGMKKGAEGKCGDGKCGGAK